MIHFGKKSRPSGILLRQRLEQEGYDGRPINFGLGIDPGGINSPDAIARAVNKREALERMTVAGVPTPKLYSYGLWGFSGKLPAVGRPDYHSKGRGFWLCYTPTDIWKAWCGTRRKARATHFMEYIENPLEFRVHVVNGKSIKISQKFGGGNHATGAVFEYPSEFNHKKSLRRYAKEAVAALGLDFGAVDILWKDDKFYVIEVNTAPCLTDENSDTLDRYVSAFMERSHA